MGKGNLSFDRGGTAAMKAQRQKAYEDWKRARFEGDLEQHKKALIGQISYMYSRFPFATDEIERLATEIVEDKVCIERLMSAVNDAVRKRAEQLAGGPPDLPEDWGAIEATVESIDDTVNSNESTELEIDKEKETFSEIVPARKEEGLLSSNVINCESSWKRWLIVAIILSVLIVACACVYIRKRSSRRCSSQG